MIHLLLGIVAGVVALTATVSTVIQINGEITKEKIRQEMRQRGRTSGVVNMMSGCTNRIKVDDLEFYGDSISDDIQNRERIFV